MKKLLIVLSIILVISMFGTSAAFAANEVAPVNRFSRYLEKLDSRYTTNIERINERATLQTERITSRSEIFLKIVADVNEDLVSNFDLAFSNHISLHKDLTAINVSLKTSFYNQFTADVTAYYNELLQQYEANEIDGKTLASSIREFTKTKHLEYKAIRDEFQDSIANAKLTNELAREQLKEYRELLETALSNDDQQSAEQALTNIYTLMLEHQEFDSYKLSLLQNILF